MRQHLSGSMSWEAWATQRWYWVVAALRHIWLYIVIRLRKSLSWVLRAGPLPQHIAFIMDGNRRFALQRHLTRLEGHHEGYSRLIDALEWCLELGVTCISVYAFSIENYKRSESEVADLMFLAQDKLEKILMERDLVDRHGVQVRVIGELHLLPIEVQRSAARVMAATRHNANGVLNICFSYTSQHEMAAAVQAANGGLRSEHLHTCDIDAGIIAECLHTAECPPVDLLVRTSGETRLSDFLLWQAGHAALEFTDVYWPEFSFWDLLKAITNYQRARPQLKSLCYSSSSKWHSSDRFVPWTHEGSDFSGAAASHVGRSREIGEAECCGGRERCAPCLQSDSFAPATEVHGDGSRCRMVSTARNRPSGKRLIRQPVCEFLRQKRTELQSWVSSTIYNS